MMTYTRYPSIGRDTHIAAPGPGRASPSPPRAHQTNKRAWVGSARGPGSLAGCPPAGCFARSDAGSAASAPAAGQFAGVSLAALAGPTAGAVRVTCMLAMRAGPLVTCAAIASEWGRSHDLPLWNDLPHWRFDDLPPWRLS